MRNLSHENEFCMQFHFHANQSHFRKNGFALRLALKQRHENLEMAYLQLRPLKLGRLIVLQETQLQL